MKPTTSNSKIMSHMKSRQLITITSVFASLAIVLFANAQSPQELLAAQTGGVKLLGVEIEEASLPTNPLKWVKIVCRFSTEKQWTDSLSLNFEAIFSDPDSKGDRLLTGGVTYMNIPKGANNAIMYVTPNTLLRFGKPKQVSVNAFRGDLPIGEVLSAGDRLRPEEKVGLLRFDGALLNVRYTPWLVIDFGKSPDLMGLN